MNSCPISCSSKMILSDDACYKVVEGEAIVLDVQSGEYFNLNETATHVLERAVAGLSLDQITQEIKEIYPENEDTVSEDIKEIIQSLLDRKILLESN